MTQQATDDFSKLSANVNNIIGDKEFKHLTRNLTRINDKYKNDVNISFIFDRNMITGYKASPIDEGSEKFLILFKERILL